MNACDKMQRSQLKDGDGTQFIETLVLITEAAGKGGVSNVGEGEANVGVAALERLDVTARASAFTNFDVHGRKRCAQRAAECFAERFESTTGNAARKSDPR